MIIATYNVNSVRAHIESFLEWLRRDKPDVVLLQEVKCETDVFPNFVFEDEGYKCAVFGQKSYNGVAILSRESLEDVHTGLGDGQARYIDAFTQGVRIANVYTPNGNPLGSEKWTYKLGWMKEFTERVRGLVALGEPLVVGGDFNVVRRDDMVYSAEAFKDDAIMQPESRAAYESLVSLGLYDAADTLGAPMEYTYYGYRGMALPKNHGIVLDYFLLNSAAKAGLRGYGVAKWAREQEHASDHAPTWIEVNL